MFYLEGIIKVKGEATDFEGPLNLILMLLSRNRIEIRDIRISEIVEQYTGFIKKMRELDLNVAGEFVQMASYLVYIKAKSLLKRENEPVPELELLMSSLEEIKAAEAYASVKLAADLFETLYLRGGVSVTKTPEPPDPGKDTGYSHDVKDLAEALYRVFSRDRGPEKPAAVEMMPEPEIYGIEEKSRMITEYLRVSGAVTGRELCGMCANRSETVAVFISVLELCAQGVLTVSAIEGDFLISPANAVVARLK